MCRGDKTSEQEINFSAKGLSGPSKEGREYFKNKEVTFNTARAANGWR